MTPLQHYLYFRAISPSESKFIVVHVIVGARTRLLTENQGSNKKITDITSESQSDLRHEDGRPRHHRGHCGRDGYRRSERCALIVNTVSDWEFHRGPLGFLKTVTHPLSIRSIRMSKLFLGVKPFVQHGIAAVATCVGTRIQP